MGLDWYGVALLLILMVGGALVAQQFGLIPTGSAPGTDINVTVGSGAWDPSWNATVVNIVSGLNLTGGNCTWQDAWNSVVDGLIGSYNVTWNNSWNSTVMDIVNGGSISWKDTWNSTVTDIVLNHAFSSLNATNLSANYLFLGSLTSDPSPAYAGQLWYRSDLDTLYFYNGTGIVVIPSIGGGSASSYTLPHTYTFYKSGSTYYAENSNGGTTSSTNLSYVANTVQNLMTTGGTIFFKAGEYTWTSPFIITRPSITIRGEGGAGTWAGNHGTTFYSSTCDIIQVTPAAYSGWEFYGPQIFDINFLGTAASGTGVTTEGILDTDKYAKFVIIDRCTFKTFDKAGEYAINLKNCENPVISNCDLKGDNEAIVRIYSTDYNTGNPLVDHCFFTTAETTHDPEHYCVLVQGGVHESNSAYKSIWGIVLRDNTFYAGSIGGGVKLEAVNEGVGQVLIDNCHFERVNLNITGSAGWPKIVSGVTVRGATWQYSTTTNRDAITIGVYVRDIFVTDARGYSGSATNVFMRNAAGYSGYPTRFTDSFPDGTWTILTNTGYNYTYHVIGLSNYWP